MDEEAAGEDEEAAESPAGGPDYDYLLGMKLWCLTQEKKDELLKHRDQKEQELKKLQVRPPPHIPLRCLHKKSLFYDTSIYILLVCCLLNRSGPNFSFRPHMTTGRFMDAQN